MIRRLLEIAMRKPEMVEALKVVTKVEGPYIMPRLSEQNIESLFISMKDEMAQDKAFFQNLIEHKRDMQGWLRGQQMEEQKHTDMMYDMLVDNIEKEIALIQNHVEKIEGHGTTGSSSEGNVQRGSNGLATDMAQTNSRMGTNF
jgi:hypothetical protein